MAQATSKNSRRIIARRDNIVAVDFRKPTNPEQPAPKFPGAAVIRTQPPVDAEDHPDVIDPHSELFINNFGRRAA